MDGGRLNLLCAERHFLEGFVHLPSDRPIIRATAANATSTPSFMVHTSGGQRGDQTASLGVHQQPDFHCKFSHRAETRAGCWPRSPELQHKRAGKFTLVGHFQKVKPNPLNVSSRQKGRRLSPGSSGCRRGFLEMLKDAALFLTEGAHLPAFL